MSQPVNVMQYPDYLNEGLGLVEPIRLSNPLVFKSHYDGDLKPMMDEVDILFNQIEYGNIGLETGKAKSTVDLDNQLHINPKFADYFKWSLPRIKDVLSMWSYEVNESYGVGWDFKKTWANEHLKGGETLEHHHGTTTLVLTMYLNKDNNSGDIWFMDPEFMIRANEYNSLAAVGWKAIPCKIGDVFMFPGWLLHRSGMNFSDSRRVVLTSNIEIIR